jgi:hypothetical protein
LVGSLAKRGKTAKARGKRGKISVQRERREEQMHGGKTSNPKQQMGVSERWSDLSEFDGTECPLTWSKASDNNNVITTTMTRMVIVCMQSMWTCPQNALSVQVLWHSQISYSHCTLAISNFAGNPFPKPGT